MTRTQIQFTKAQLEALRARASREKVSVSELVRRAVDALVKSERLPTDDEKRRRAIDAAGRFSSGKSDVARRHDDYLADAYNS